MDAEVSRWVITILLSVIGFLLAAGYKSLIDRVTSIERKQAALLVALMFFMTTHNPPPPPEVLAALQSAIK